MRSFVDMLIQYRQGRAVDLLTRDLAECVRAVDETGKAAELSIKIKVEPEKGGGAQKDLTITRKATLPRQDIPKAVFFSDDEGGLHRSDPNQSEMFSDVPAKGRA